MKTRKKEVQDRALIDTDVNETEKEFRDRIDGLKSQSTVSGSLVGAIIEKTYLRKAHPSHHASLLGTCLRPFHPDHKGLCEVRFEEPVGKVKQGWLPYIDGIALRENDSVLLITPTGSRAPIVVGRLSGSETTHSWVLPSGHKLVVEKQQQAGGSFIRLELPDGRTALEINFSGETPIVRLPQKDVSLDLEGRLKIAARSIDLVSKLGNVNVKANDDFKVTAERIWLN